jgi:hypothetical protein
VLQAECGDRRLGFVTRIRRIRQIDTAPECTI